RRSREFPNVQLLHKLASRGQRLNKYCLLIGNIFGNGVKIFEWQREIFRESAVVAQNPEHRAPRTMRFQSAAAKIAHRLEAVARTADVDLARHALPHPAFLNRRRTAADFNHLS